MIVSVFSLGIDFGGMKMKKVLLVCILTIFIAVNFCGCEKRNNDNILDSELEIKEKNININDSTMNIENSKDVNDSEVSIEISEDIVKNIENITSNLDGEVTEIIWAFPNHSFETATESVEKRINNKLEEDGYKFRLKCMFIDLDGYEDNIIDCDADIVYTGLKADTESLSSAYLAIKEGKYKCLDDFLESSNLYDFFPEILWESVRMDGKIYCIPNVALPDSGLAIVLKKERYSKQASERRRL